MTSSVLHSIMKAVAKKKKKKKQLLKEVLFGLRTFIRLIKQKNQLVFASSIGILAEKVS